jgi:hypothetical protein
MMPTSRSRSGLMPCVNNLSCWRSKSRFKSFRFSLTEPRESLEIWKSRWQLYKSQVLNNRKSLKFSFIKLPWNSTRFKIESDKSLIILTFLKPFKAIWKPFKKSQNLTTV